MIQKIINFYKIDFQRERIYGFDIIRFFAIVSVLYGHGTLITKPAEGSLEKSLLFLDGVFVFFILSGFLIGQLLIHTIENKEVNKKTLVSFWKKRLLRTLPAYYFVLIILIVLSLITIKGFGNIKTLSYFVFIQNFYTEHPFFFTEAWTLSIEIWFYLFVPLTIFLFKIYLKLSDKKAILYSIFIFITFGFLVRWYRCLNLQHIDGTVIDFVFRKQVVTRIGSVTFGLLGSYIYRYYNNIWSNFKYLFLTIGIAIFYYTVNPLFEEGKFYRLVLFYDLQSISFLLMLPYFSTLKNGKGIVYEIITTLSYASFSIYLINLNIVQVFFLDKIDLIQYLGIYYIPIKYFLFIFFSVTGGIFMYKKIELPFMNMRQKIS